MIIDFTSGAISQQPTALPMGVWNWSIVAGEEIAADPVGLEYTPPGQRLHYTPSDNRLHYTPPDNRLHYTPLPKG